ncbi:hypothetical protein HCN51_46160 [Nonomuraea sp. FMUSA5-5]|uniref:DUF2092 domain-containing protein n=1 Tax=Nonomuraea composti TaxID=2720023 RepID=A0ABX1BPN1_9ACTN|nr:hypothetical protein [Nonomuraea sp. FMUSA5-5]NJP96733.1 hypothetical protein [Nonomuraea sp. FMUSA5-5]
MKRSIIGVAVVAGMVQLTAMPAQAAASASDPVTALKAELAPGRAVNLQATAKITYPGDRVVTSAVDGTFGLGSRGPVASDLGQTVQYSDKLLREMKKSSPKETEGLQAGPVRLISSGSVSYVSGPVVEQTLLTQNAAHVRYTGVKQPPSNLLVEVLDPATLKALVAARSSWKDGILKGTIKPAKLAAVSQPFASRYGTRFKTGKISYTLYFGDKGLVRRVAVKATLPVAKTTVQVESDTRFSDWGREVTVNLPLRGDVIDRAEVKGDVPAGVPGIWN